MGKKWSADNGSVRLRRESPTTAPADCPKATSRLQYCAKEPKQSLVIAQT